MRYHYYVLALILYFFIPTPNHNEALTYERSKASPQKSTKRDEVNYQKILSDMNKLKDQLITLEQKSSQIRKDMESLITDLQHQK